MDHHEQALQQDIRVLNYTLCRTVALVAVGGWFPYETGTPLPIRERWTHKAIYLFDFPVA